ncbi:MAG: sodium-dependent transporter, partial [Ruminococcus sp.]|nr:sodium-dependent transporter [Ruminococcus sp.]
LEQISGHFTDMLDSPGTMILWTCVTIFVCIGICSLGLKNGVEKITKVMMIMLIILMIVMAVRSVTLKNSLEGIKFYLIPDFQRMAEQGIGNVVFAAMTHAFFTISVGIGSMEIFGSYLSDERRLTGEAVNVVTLDTVIALTAGIIIIPACFAYGVAPDAGPSLLFITLPNVFNHMPGGIIWGTMFFIFMSFAALSTVIAVFENIISISQDIFGWERKKSVIANLIGITILSMPAVLGYNILSGIKPIGEGTTIMDLEDFIVSYNILPLGSLIVVMLCTKKNGWGFENFRAETDKGDGLKFPAFLRGYITFVLPVIILVIYLKGYYDMFAPQGKAVLTIWMIIAVLLALFIFWLAFSVTKKAAAKADKG